MSWNDWTLNKFNNASLTLPLAYGRREDFFQGVANGGFFQGSQRFFQESAKDLTHLKTKKTTFFAKNWIVKCQILTSRGPWLPLFPLLQQSWSRTGTALTVNLNIPQLETNGWQRNWNHRRVGMSLSLTAVQYELLNFKLERTIAILRKWVTLKGGPADWKVMFPNTKIQFRRARRVQGGLHNNRLFDARAGCWKGWLLPTPTCRRSLRWTAPRGVRCKSGMFKTSPPCSPSPWGSFGGLSPTKQSSKPRQIELWNTIN